MFSKRSLLSASIVFLIQGMAYAVEVGDYNYRGGAGDEQFNIDHNTGVDMKALIECGYNYANGNCNSSNPSVQKGYGDAINIQKGTNDARSANNNKDIYDPTNPKNLGINSMDDNRNIVKYADTRDLTKQQSTITELYGGAGDVSSLTATYNTNTTPDKDGLALKTKCFQYTDAKLSQMAQSTVKADVDLANQCLVIRTVSNANDQAIVSGFSETDPLRSSIVKRNYYKDEKTGEIKGNKVTNGQVSSVDNKSATSVKKVNDMSYSCDVEPTRTEYLSSTCNTKTVGRQQTCTQNRVVQCGSNVKGTRDLPECIAGMESSSIRIISTTRPLNTFNKDNTGFSFYETWSDGGSTHKWVVGFLVNNPDRIGSITLSSFSYDNSIQIVLNGTLIGQGQTGSSATQRPYMDLKPYIKQGQNTMEVTVVNWSGPALGAAVVNISPDSFQGCSCKESWVTSCSINKVGI